MPRTLVLWIAFTGWGAMFAIAMILAAVVLGSSGSNSVQSRPSASTPASGPIGTIEIRAFDLGFEPSMVHVAAPGTYTVRFMNDGGTLHDVTFADRTKVEAAAHSAETGEVTIPAAGLSFICSVPGHADGGMRGDVMVTSGGAATPSPAASLTAEQFRDADAARDRAVPGRNGGQGQPVLEPKIGADGTKEWDLAASVIQWETEPGVVLEAYAYNGTVPGPQLRAEVGDRVRITLHNELTEPTTIHFHGQLVPNEVDGVPVITQPA